MAYVTGSERRWTVRARDRVGSQLPGFLDAVSGLVGRNANEGDTRLLVTDALSDALGYDKYTNLTTELPVRGAVYGITLGRRIVALVEIRRCSMALAPRSSRQIETYAAGQGVSWLILTNGAVWRLHKLIAGLPPTVDLVLETNLLDDTISLATKVDAMSCLTRESFEHHQIEEVWKATAAIAPDKIARALLSEAVLNTLCAEIWQASRQRVGVADLAHAIHDKVLRPELAK